MNKKVVDVENVDLKKLRELLRYGDRQKVMDRTGYCKQYVYSVLDPNNPRINEEIIQEAIKVVEEGRKVEMDEDLAKELVA